MSLKFNEMLMNFLKTTTCNETGFQIRVYPCTEGYSSKEGTTLRYPAENSTVISTLESIMRHSLKLQEKISIDSTVSELFEGLVSVIQGMIWYVDLYLNQKGIEVSVYRMGVYDLGEGEYRELRPFIEIYTNVESVSEMLGLWRETIEVLSTVYGDELFNDIDVFFTRV